MTRSVAAFLHAPSSQPFYDDDRLLTISSSISEGDSGHKNGNGVIVNMDIEVQLDCDVEISSEDVQLGNEEAPDLCVRGAPLSRDDVNECVNRKRVCLESSVGGRPAFGGGWERGISEEVPAVNAALKDGGFGFPSAKCSQQHHQQKHLVGPQVKFSSVQHNLEPGQDNK